MEPVAASAGHPVIILMGSRGNIRKHYLLLEGQATEVPSLLSAVDKTFKMFYTFHLAYPDMAQHVW
jgi:hypothetical protein